jgi:hypothetical protein
MTISFNIFCINTDKESNNLKGIEGMLFIKKGK